MFPERELEDLLHLIERLGERIAQIDDVGMLDASVLGEVVHPRTFNSLRRVKDGDVTVLDEEEARAELAGPELLLQSLREMLNKQGAEEVLNLPDGIHSGLRRSGKDGMFFYFKTPRSNASSTGGDGFRHFWRYADTATGAVCDNRFEIAQIIACRADEPRFIGSQDVFKCQSSIVANIIASDAAAAVRDVVSTANDPIQLTLAEDLKQALRRGTVDRERTRPVLQFLGQPVGRSLVQKFKTLRKDWDDRRDDSVLLAELTRMMGDYAKDAAGTGPGVTAEQLRLVCFEHVSS